MWWLIPLLIAVLTLGVLAGWCRNAYDNPTPARSGVEGSVQKARIDHGCNACLGRISRGERYLAQFLVDGGDRWMWKSHELCDYLYWKLWRDQGLYADEQVDVSEIRDSLVEFFNAFNLGRETNATANT